MEFSSFDTVVVRHLEYLKLPDDDIMSSRLNLFVNPLASIINHKKNLYNQLWVIEKGPL